MGRQRHPRAHVPHGWPEPFTWTDRSVEGEVRRRFCVAPLREQGARRNAIGRAAERRLLGVLEDAAERGTLVVSARAATAVEDANGIDIVAATRRGRLDVQVKASVARAAVMRAVYEARGIMVVAAPPDETDEQLRARFARALDEHRARCAPAL